MSDRSDPIRASLGAYADMAVHLFDTVDSTNSEARRHAAEESCPALYLARTQTGGRGRLGRSFHSPADTGLYMTLAYSTDRPLAEAVRVTALAAVAAVSAIEALTDRSPRIKWVNDLYLGDAKLAGILTEAVTLADGGTRMLVGIGINLSTESFPAGLRAPATALFAADEAHTVTDAFVGTLAGEIARRLLDLAAQTMHDECLPDGESCLDVYRRHLLWVGRRVTCTRGHEVFEGIIRGVDDDYSLLVDADGSLVTLGSGEITIRVAE